MSLADDLSTTTLADTEDRIRSLELGEPSTHPIAWRLADVAMRLGWLAAHGAHGRVFDRMVRRFRALEVS
jgi:hypothetical protein